MKLDTISKVGRKKDFWDLSDILEEYRLSDLLKVYEQKYPWLEIKDVLKGFSDFTITEQMPDPICYKNKDWETVKDEIIQTLCVIDTIKDKENRLFCFV